jgi:hypothetical protein
LEPANGPGSDSTCERHGASPFSTAAAMRGPSGHFFGPLRADENLSQFLWPSV